jgi:hypothetical protein
VPIDSKSIARLIEIHGRSFFIHALLATIVTSLFTTFLVAIALITLMTVSSYQFTDLQVFIKQWLFYLNGLVAFVLGALMQRRLGGYPTLVWIPLALRLAIYFIAYLIVEQNVNLAVNHFFRNCSTDCIDRWQVTLPALTALAYSLGALTSQYKRQE